ncbi:MAG: hypothetical protein Q8K98_00795 [Bacteroidota bacterium]|nr:hypothetical protein [Bacteroidota bacterium]
MAEKVYRELIANLLISRNPPVADAKEAKDVGGIQKVFVIRFGEFVSFVAWW